MTVADDLAGAPEDYLGAFLGPKSENAALTSRLVETILEDYFHWRRNYHPNDARVLRPHELSSLAPRTGELEEHLEQLLAGLRRSIPFYSPRYIAHQQGETSLPALLGALAGMLYNANNVTSESGSVTVDYEIEACNRLLRMIGYTTPPEPPATSDAALLARYQGLLATGFGWCHLTSGGTVANIEALWVARAVRYFPLSVRDAAEQHDLTVPVSAFDPASKRHVEVSVRDLDPPALLDLNPREAIYLLPRYLSALAAKLGRHATADDGAEIARKAWEWLDESPFSLRRGVAKCFSTYPPAVLATGAAHYSLKKAVDLLGIGWEGLVDVAMDGHFRMSVASLEEMLDRLADPPKGKTRRWPLAVVAIVGTTEEGAVDPLDGVLDLRKKREREGRGSFWVHADAAWGGYLSIMFAQPDGSRVESGTGEAELDLTGFPRERLALRLERYSSNEGLSREFSKEISVGFDDTPIRDAMLALSRADSVTVDPHKMGYLPYPAGGIAFADDWVRYFIRQEAPYITQGRGATNVLHEPPRHPARPEEDAWGNQAIATEAFAPYTLEGSRPSFPATALWLSTRVLPLDRDHHGRVVRGSWFAARVLYEWLLHLDKALSATWEHEPGFEVLLPIGDDRDAAPPDTNLVIFCLRPRGTTSLEAVNELTKRVYHRFSISAELGERAFSYSQPFFLSTTPFSDKTYGSAPLEGFFTRYGFGDGWREQYCDVPEQGRRGRPLEVLRATVMNPYIAPLLATGRQDLIREFVLYLADVAERETKALAAEQDAKTLEGGPSDSGRLGDA